MTLSVHKQLRHLFAVISGATPQSGNADYWNGNILWATPEDVSSLDDYWLRATRRMITREGYESCGAAIAPPNSVVLTKRAPIGQVALLADEACSNQGCFLLVPRAEADTRFYYYWLSVQTHYLQTLGRGSTFMELSTDELKSLSTPHPPWRLQRTIADYLDHETARLDGLLAAKERVLGLLAEKRRALITRAVTRGLDPDAPRRDSVISWLGEIPAHWEIVRLRFLAEGIEQGWSPEAAPLQPSLDDWGVLKLNAVNRGRFDEKAAKTLPLNAQPRVNLEIHAGDVLVTRSNTPLLVGDACFVETTRPRLMLSDIIYRLAVRPGVIDGRFLVYFLTLPVGRVQIENDARGTSASMVKISQEHLKNWWIPVPPIEEQRSITTVLAAQTQRIDRMRAATERTVALIKERRFALIAAAVAGQIDVALSA